MKIIIEHVGTVKELERVFAAIFGEEKKQEEREVKVIAPKKKYRRRNGSISHRVGAMEEYIRLSGRNGLTTKELEKKAPHLSKGMNPYYLAQSLYTLIKKGRVKRIRDGAYYRYYAKDVDLSPSATG